MQITCVICAGTHAEPWLSDCRDTYLHEPGRVDYVRCEACGLVQQHPMPAALEALYADYPVHARKSMLHKLLRPVLFRSAYFDASTLPDGSALLDAGCGDGWYLESLGSRLQRAGMEPNRAHAARLTQELGLSVYDSWPAIVASHRAAFDAVTLHYLLEHVADPRQILANARQVLKSGGLMYVLVPNIHSWEARLFGRNWHGLDAPRHVIFPDDANMRRLADDAGFVLERSVDAAFPNTLASSICVSLSGRHRDWLFKAWLPAAIAVDRVAPQGSRAYYLRAH